MRARTLAAVVLAGILGLVMAAPLAAQTGQSPDAPAVEEIEIVDAGDDVPAGPGPAGFWDFVGRLHHGVVHLPIGWLLLMVLLDIAAFGFNRRAAEDVGLWTLGLTVLSFVPGIVTGMLRAAHLREAPEIAVLVGQHQAIMAAIDARDPDGAVEAMRFHLTEILRALPKVEAEHPELFE